MDISVTGFKATTSIKPSEHGTMPVNQLGAFFQAVTDSLADETMMSSYWTMCGYNPSGKHTKNDVTKMSGIILEYDMRYVEDLVRALQDMPWHYLLVETARKGGEYISVFFPLAFEPDTGRYMRIAAVLAYQLGVYGLSQGSGTPTFLVKLVGGQKIIEHKGPAIPMSFVKETENIDPKSKTALEHYTAAKPAKPELSKNQKIAEQFRLLADLFDVED